VLSIEGVSKRFEGGVVLEALDLTVKDGEFLCLLGPTGCGKTTLLRMLCGLVPPDCGRITLSGRPIRPGVDACLVFQHYGLFPWLSVLDNVAFGLKLRGVSAADRQRQAQQFLALVGLEGFEQHYPHQISGGMQQRVGLARALLNAPRVLLMDEPFAAVDALTRERLQEQLLEIWDRDRKTVVFVTHSIDEAIFLADRVVVMGLAPRNVRDDVITGLPRPRPKRIRLSEDYLHLMARLRRSLGGEDGGG
jgi:NitT/TauT family transport system ATP-binding protein